MAPEIAQRCPSTSLYLTSKKMNILQSSTRAGPYWMYEVYVRILVLCTSHCVACFYHDVPLSMGQVLGKVLLTRAGEISYTIDGVG